MTVEYQLLHHAFAPDQPPPQKVPFNFFKPVVIAPPPVESKPDVWFRLNLLHDVDSARWLYCSLLFHSLPSSVNDRASFTSIAEVQEFATTLFGYARQATAPRYSFVTTPQQHAQAVKLLEPIYCLDEEYGHLLLQGLQTFKALVGFYRTVEATKPVPVGQSFMWASRVFEPDFYRTLQAQFFAIHHHLRGSTISALPLPHCPSLKRRRDVDELGYLYPVEHDEDHAPKRAKTEQPDAGPSASGLKLNPKPKTIYGQSP